jgi:fumarylpyruvate hydrolase
LPPVLAETSAGDSFPVRRIFCVGRNYAAHAREMGMNPDKEPPFFFAKFAEAVVPSGSVVAYPPQTHDFHYEGELVVAIGTGGRNIDPADALDHVFGYASGLDMTRRDLQFQARDAGRPWDVSKNFEQAAPLGTIHPVSETGYLSGGRISLTVNGETRQDADLSDMIWPVADIVAHLSRLYRIEPGDLIYTGTPAGVGPVKEGDRVVVSIEGLSDTSIVIGPPASP